MKSGKLPDIKTRINKLVERLSLSDDDLFDAIAAEYGNKATLTESTRGRYLYIDNGANILAVAHIDTVDNDYLYYNTYSDRYWVEDAVDMPQTPHRPKVVGKWINSIRLDDRLGVHLILDILPLLGVVVDVLLTDNEESAQSTARLFHTPDGKKYNWGFSFDRRGVGECVMYQYGKDYAASSLLAPRGWALGKGSYSDIADLNIGCVCFNFSAGYFNEHTDYCECHYDNVTYTARLFARFYRANVDTLLPFNFVPRTRYTAWTPKTGALATVPSTSTNKLTPGTPCAYCNKNDATGFDGTDKYAEPICDACMEYISQYDDDEAEESEDSPDLIVYGRGRECLYCGCHTPPDDMDSDIPGVCTGCARWLRDNGREDEIEVARQLYQSGG